MKENLRIKDKREFDLFFHKATVFKNYFFIMYIMERKNELSRIGIAISNKFGKDYKRNLYKRRLRNIMRINYEKFNQKYDYIVLIKKSCDTIDYEEMENKFLDLLKKVK